MRIHLLFHNPVERSGLLELWCAEEGHSMGETLLGRDPLPSPDSFDALIVMGGPMGTYEEETYPWLAVEKRFIRETIDSGKGVLGICLGSQLIASALGCRVFPNIRQEIGWFPVTALPGKEKANLFSGCADKVPVLHWHGDTFDTVPGMIMTYSSETTPHQAFQYGDRVVGLQFHPEMTPGLLEQFCEAFETVPGPSVQTAGRILEQAELMGGGTRFMKNIWTNWISVL